MTHNRTLVRNKLVWIACAASLLMLTACGQGYEPQPYHGFPYDNVRTAGTGVIYVRVNMMPQKGPMLKEAPAPAAPGAAEPEPVKTFSPTAEKMFKSMQKK